MNTISQQRRDRSADRLTDQQRVHYINTRNELRRLGHEAAMYSRRIRSATDWNHKVRAKADWMLTRSKVAHEIVIWKALRDMMKPTTMRSAAE